MIREWFIGGWLQEKFSTANVFWSVRLWMMMTWLEGCYSCCDYSAALTTTYCCGDSRIHAWFCCCCCCYRGSCYELKRMKKTGAFCLTGCSRSCPCLCFEMSMDLLLLLKSCLVYEKILNWFLLQPRKKMTRSLQLQHRSKKVDVTKKMQSPE